ncbi:unnamed protein product [Closterium sp. Naga37s-1]|nr:unnamed protein product [Closterium sp. Naga37s-1]
MYEILRTYSLQVPREQIVRGAAAADAAAELGCDHSTCNSPLPFPSTTHAMPLLAVSSSKPPTPTVTTSTSTSTRTSTRSSNSSSPSSGAIAGIVLGCVVGLILLFLLAIWAHKARKASAEKTEHAGKDEKDVEAGKAGAESGDKYTGLGGPGAAEAAAAAAMAAGAVRQEEAAAAAVAEARPLVCRQYSLAEVAAATGEWAEANRIGSGSFGDVYKGANPTAPHEIWAVKRAKILTNDFKREVNEMATKNHPNLVRLLGYCFDMNHTTERIEQIVIYEFMSNGDLERWIGPREILPSALLYSTLLESSLLFSTLVSSTIVYATLVYSNLLHSTIVCFTLLHSTRRCFASLHQDLLHAHGNHGAYVL